MVECFVKDSYFSPNLKFVNSIRTTQGFFGQNVGLSKHVSKKQMFFPLKNIFTMVQSEDLASISKPNATQLVSCLSRNFDNKGSRVLSNFCLYDPHLQKWDNSNQTPERVANQNSRYATVYLQIDIEMIHSTIILQPIRIQEMQLSDLQSGITERRSLVH